MFHYFQSEHHFSLAIANLLGKTGLAVLMLGAISDKALADPPPAPPPNTQLPSVFCFRFTDIKAVENDPEGDKFQLSFEVLNWSNQPAGGVRIARNTGSNGLVLQDAPFLAGAGVDGNGRPLGNGANPLPGNQTFTNTGQLVESTQTAVQWTASQFDFFGGTNGPIPNQNLLGVPSQGGTALACSMVPGCQVQGNTPVVADWETVDNGNNVLDGFVITVDDFDEGESLSFNWNLLDVNGNPIGTPGQGNAYGFGTVNIGRVPINEDPSIPGHSDIAVRPLFPGNTGLIQTPNVFAQNSYQVTEYGPNNQYDDFLTPSPPAPTPSARTASLTRTTFGATSLSAASSESIVTQEPTIIAEFAAEFGAGITAPFLNPADNIFASATNVVPIDYSAPDPKPDPDPNPNPDPNPVPPTKVPEPNTLGAIALAGLGLLGSKYRRRRKA
ncbi:PEP-CTERM sorting domain-containing protein [Roseofilum reptotaenium CS-1145]|uniref:Ice-binding protein C-terminal domain-containing protein n=1 Tax=Roseofilum reptotaenium AO1-A TaxID=1925591 RepID=A0A1L9QKB9_9CYAN|nr:PEP-CTERM sorting domain-containing protein [Roseofilum reptotaenium]MDB9516887.1 PEP-CTERM sorting domain-containing protein [Roseofilum reptotaenium CS-1145]OJJ16514.1 hypothetical protein BI308_23625 [Roseofilum reptotaenium AO1-A]